MQFKTIEKLQITQSHYTRDDATRVRKKRKRVLTIYRLQKIQQFNDDK